MERQIGKEPKNRNSLREILERKQAQLDEVLHDLYPDIELMNLQLETLSITSGPNKDKLVADFAEGAIESLDSRWPFLNDFLHVSGNWNISDVKLNLESIEFPMLRQPAFNIVQSDGFALHMPENETPRIGLSFAYDKLGFMSGAIRGQFLKLAFADMGDVTLSYVQPSDKEALMSDISDMSEKLFYYDQLLLLHYQNSNSEFYKKTARQQLKFLTNVTDSVNDSLPSPQNGYRAICEQITVPYFYRRVVDFAGHKWQKITTDDSNSIMISGIVEGVGILDSLELAKDMPLRGKDQLVDVDAGLCLILQVDQISVADVFNNQPIFVPVRLAEDCELSIP